MSTSHHLIRLPDLVLLVDDQNSSVTVIPRQIGAGVATTTMTLDAFERLILTAMARREKEPS